VKVTVDGPEVTAHDLGELPGVLERIVGARRQPFLQVCPDQEPGICLDIDPAELGGDGVDDGGPDFLRQPAAGNLGG
jgi:hypothetical protein